MTFFFRLIAVKVRKALTFLLHIDEKKKIFSSRLDEKEFASKKGRAHQRMDIWRIHPRKEEESSRKAYFLQNVNGRTKFNDPSHLLFTLINLDPFYNALSLNEKFPQN